MERFTFKVNHGDEEFVVVTDDRVTPDASMGQYDTGWWVTRQGTAPEGKPDEYFLSDDGILYATEDGKNFDKAVGRASERTALND